MQNITIRLACLVTDSYEIWNEHHAITGHPTFVCLYLLYRVDPLLGKGHETMPAAGAVDSK
jgi:hypothetical protein